MSTTYSTQLAMQAICSGLAQSLISDSRILTDIDVSILSVMSLPADDAPYEVPMTNVSRARTYFFKADNRVKMHLNGNTAVSIPVDLEVAGYGSAASISDGVEITSIQLRNSGTTDARVTYFLAGEVD